MSTFGPLVTSLQNRWVKYARSLHRSKVRHEERAFLVEGRRLLADALDAGAAPTLVFFVPGQHGEIDRLAHRAAERGARVIPTEPDILEVIADTTTPQGIVAVVPFPDLRYRPVAGCPPLFLVTDAVSDPGNLGTLLRSSLGAGVGAVYVGPGTVDPYSPKVVRAAASAHFRLPIQPLDWSRPPDLVASCSARLAATMEGERVYDEVDWTVDACLIVGSEAHGLSPGARALANGTVRIPLTGNLESLNAAMAGSIILFEAARQRRHKGIC